MSIEIGSVREGVWEIAPAGGMRVPARIYASEKLLAAARSDESLVQACNVAHLPGIVGASLAMPDLHEGYGFPIGGVAAFDADDGVVSPGGVGYDINCGVRLMRTDIRAADLGRRLRPLLQCMQRDVPAGLGSQGAIATLSDRDLDEVLRDGAAWAVRTGTARPRTSRPPRPVAPSPAPTRRRSRAARGSAGRRSSAPSDRGTTSPSCRWWTRSSTAWPPPSSASVEGNLTVLLHSGSRGLGYQVCDDALAAMREGARRITAPLPDPQLVAAPASSPEGRRYLAAMRAAANFAWANRQVMMALIERAVARTLGGDRTSSGFALVYDVAHNIAKLEEHEVAGARRRLLVHRKGATRAFPAGHPDVPSAYRAVGQPVFIPGDMGRPSFVCVGTDTAMLETFGSAAHGAGRTMSRHAARRAAGGRDLIAEMERRGVLVAAHSPKTLAEEMPDAYKDAADVVEALRVAGIARPVARLRPIAVVKG